MAKLRPADVFDKAAELLAEGDEHLVLILDRLCLQAWMIRWRASRPRGGGGTRCGLTVKEGDELLAGALRA